MSVALSEPRVRVLGDVMVPMRDGVRLAADIYLPTGAGEGASAFPVLLERTPYDRRGSNNADRTEVDARLRSRPEIAAELAAAGYAVVLQDCRGRYGSEGVFQKYVNEADDGIDTLAWIRTQPWCEGRVGTYGLSYGAHVQSAIAGAGPQGVAAMFMDSGAFSSAYHSGIRQGGAFELKQATWTYKHALLSPETLRDPLRQAALESQDIRQWFARTPWSEGRSPVSAAPEYEAYLLEQWRTGRFGDYWRQPGLYARGSYAAFPDVPMLFVVGWYDPYARAAVENQTALAALKTAPVKLIIGPWTHGQRSVTYAGDVDFGPASTFDQRFPPDYFAFRRQWFDNALGRAKADPMPATISLFVMGGGSGRKTAEGRFDHGGRWRDYGQFPLAEARETILHLHASGALSEQAPTDIEAFREYAHDPAHPVPTIGGPIASGAPIMAAGAFDQREGPGFFASTAPGRAIAERDDVLVFETEPLAAPVEVIGFLTADLWVSSSAPDTDFTVKLVDVAPANPDYPEGYALNLAHGILRARYRDGFEGEVWMQPGEVYPLTIDGFPTANRFEVGHRIRLEVASSNFPHFDVNPNSGEPEGYSNRPQVARNRIYMDTSRPSRLRLSIVPTLDAEGGA